MAPLSVATALDLAAAGALVFGGGGGGPARWIFALGLHLLAVTAASLASRTSRSQRFLTAALTFTLPVLGAPIALLTLGIRGRGEVGEVPAREAADPWPMTVTAVRRITDGLSVWESLMSGTPAERAATVAMLARRGDRASIALLRRAVAVGSADVAVEAAMALEELHTGPDREAGAA
jgi:hypothetical protein